MGHPSRTAREGNLPSDNVVTRGVNKDFGAFSDRRAVYCRQCGFIANLDRDARKVDEFAGETIGQGTRITDHGYPTRSEYGAGDIYEGSERSITALSAELLNGSFENWTVGNPNNWTVSGTTVEEETSSGYFDKSDDGISSAKITRNGSDVSLSQVMATPSDFNSNTVIFRARVKSSTNGVIRLRIDVNSVSYYSAYNIAQQNFQELSVLVICPASVSSLTVYILADDANGVAYIDQCILNRSGNPITASIRSGCPMCGSYNYY